MIVEGFVDPVIAAQGHFRAVLDAMSRPGRIVRLPGELPAPPWPLAPGTFALALTLLDYETPVWLDPEADRDAVQGNLRLHCGCPLTSEPGRAAFALVTAPDRMPPLSAFGQGTPEYPDRSTTIILQVAGLRDDAGCTLRGPGIETVASLAVEGAPDGFWAQVERNHRQFPQGVDLILVAGDRIAALPRSVEASACT